MRFGSSEPCGGKWRLCQGPLCTFGRCGAWTRARTATRVALLSGRPVFRETICRRIETRTPFFGALLHVVPRTAQLHHVPWCRSAVGVAPEAPAVAEVSRIAVAADVTAIRLVMWPILFLGRLL